MHLWLRRTGRTGWWAYALGGAAIATLAMAIPHVAEFTTPGDLVALELAGITAGLTFRYIVGPGAGAQGHDAPVPDATTSSPS